MVKRLHAIRKECTGLLDRGPWCYGGWGQRSLVLRRVATEAAGMVQGPCDWEAGMADWLANSGVVGGEFFSGTNK